jgi:molecular chaperone DnaK
MGVLGIDLGTTNTVVAAVRSGRARVLADGEGRKLLPSVVSFPATGEVLVGSRARDLRHVDARNTVFSVKRLIGRAWMSPEVVEARIRYPYELKEGPGHGPLVVARGKEFTLPEISAFVLRRARLIAEAALGEPVGQAVVTVPASFNELQRAATKVAGRVAGLDVLRILNEPTAAALAYGLGHGRRERVAIYDFGGGTFDCTLLELSGSVFEVLATSGDSFLGGDDLDTLLAERMSEAFVNAFRFDPRAYPDAFERLRLAAEALKQRLSGEDVAQVTLREETAGGVLELPFVLTRAELEAIAKPLVDRTLAVTREALALAARPASAFDTVVLVGGSTRMPLVRRAVEEFFGKAPRSEINPEEVVAIGAAVQAAALSEPRKPAIPAPPPVSSTSSLRRIATLSSSLPAPPPLPPRAKSSRPPPLVRPSVPSPPRMPPPAALEEEPDPFPKEAPTAPRHPRPSIPPEVPPDVPSTLDIHSLAPPMASAPGSERPSERPTLTEAPPEGTAARALASISSGAWNESVSGEPPPSPRHFPRPASIPPTALPRPPYGADDTTPYGVTAVAAPEAPGPVNEAVARSAWSAPGSERPSPIVEEAPEAPTFPPPPVLVDVTPRALVVETAGGFCDVVIPRNARIPCECIRTFATAAEGQRAVRIRVAQGEAPLFADNTFVGEVELLGLRPAARGDVSVQITFQLDASGLLRVRALDLLTGHETEATLQLAGVATEGSVARMLARQAEEVMGPS